MRTGTLLLAALTFVGFPNLLWSQCHPAVDPCHCLTMNPTAPAIGDVVTVALLIDGQPTQIGPPAEPICFISSEVELCLTPGDVAFDFDGSISFEWTAEIDQVMADGGVAAVWDGLGFLQPDGRLALVSLEELFINGAGCSTCAGVCDAPACSLHLVASFNADPPGGDLALEFTVGTASPAAWSVFIVVGGGIVPLWSIDLPAIPEITLPPIVFAFPSIGSVGFLTLLTANGEITCSDWEVVDTRHPDP